MSIPDPSGTSPAPATALGTGAPLLPRAGLHAHGRAVAPAAARAMTVIRPRSRWAPLDLGELWRHRDLLYFLAWRDVMVRYKQTLIGVAWAVLQPAALALLFALVFGRFAGLGSDGIPYPVYAYAALLMWQPFSHALTQASNSLIANAPLVTKVYCPRLALPLASVLSGVVDVAVSSLFLVPLLLWYGVVPGPTILALPFFLGLAVMAALALGIGLSAVSVKYRDVQHALPFVTQLWLFATPVAYSSQLIPEAYRVLYGLNPMVGVIDGFRWALFGGAFPTTYLVESVVVTSVLFLASLWVFRAVEDSFADVI